jgi:hypothetical protein
MRKKPFMSASTFQVRASRKLERREAIKQATVAAANDTRPVNSVKLMLSRSSMCNPMIDIPTADASLTMIRQ